MRRLQSLLRLRAAQQRQADVALAEAYRRREDAEAALWAATRSDDAVSTVPRPTSLPDLLAMRMAGMADHEQRVLAADALELRRREELDARAARTAAASRHRSVERVIERRDVAAQLVARRAARRALADLARLRAVSAPGDPPAAGGQVRP